MTESTPKYAFNKQFLDSFLIAAIIGSMITLVLNSLIKNLPVLVVVNSCILFGLILSYVVLKLFKRVNASMFISTVVVLASIVFWFFSSSGYYGGVTITVIMVLGYIYSLTLARPIRLYAHAFVFCLLIVLLIYQFYHVEEFKYVTNPTDIHILATGVAFLILYLIIITSSSALRDKYEKVNDELTAQKEELNVLNAHLERLVEQRTASLHTKTEQMAQYSFKNAHEVRGSLARILGLLSLKNMDTSFSENELLELIGKEAQDMDAILKQISIDLYNGMKE